MKKKILSLILILCVLASYIYIPSGISYAAENVYTKAYDFSSTPSDFSNVFVTRGNSASTPTVTGGVLSLTPGYRGNWYTWHKEGNVNGGDGTDTGSIIYNCSKLEISFDITLVDLTGSSSNVFMEQFYYNGDAALPLIKINKSAYVYVGSNSSYSAKVSAGKPFTFKRIVDFKNGEIKTYIGDSLIHTYTGEVTNAVRSYIEVTTTYASTVSVDNYTIKRTHESIVSLAFDENAELAKDLTGIFKPLKFSTSSCSGSNNVILYGSSDKINFEKITSVPIDAGVINADVSRYSYFKLAAVKDDGTVEAESSVISSQMPVKSQLVAGSDFSEISSGVSYTGAQITSYSHPLMGESLYMDPTSSDSDVALNADINLSDIPDGTIYSLNANFVFDSFDGEQKLFETVLSDEEGNRITSVYPIVSSQGELSFSNNVSNQLMTLETGKIYTISLVANVKDNVQYLFADGTYVAQSDIYETNPYCFNEVKCSVGSGAASYIDNLYLRSFKLENCTASNLTYGLNREDGVARVRIANDATQRNIMLICAVYTYDDNDKKELSEIYTTNAFLPAGSLEKDFTFDLGKAKNGKELTLMFIDSDTLYPLSETQVITLKNVVEITDQKVYANDSANINLLKNTFAIHMASGNVFSKNKKITDLPMPYVENGEYMVPEEVIEMAFGKDVNINEDENIISIGNVATLGVYSDVMTITGKQPVTLLAAPSITDDVLYLPLKAISEDVFGKKLTAVTADVNNGLVVVSDSTFSVSSSKVQDLNSYLFFDRPSPQKILSDYKVTSTYGEHPRLMLTDALTAKIKEESKVSGSYKKTWRSRLMDRANQLTTQTADGTAVVEYVFPDGLRLLNECEKFKGYMMILGLAYNLTGDGSYARTAWQHIKTVSEFPDWNPRHHLDVGSMSAGYAIAYDWMYDYWTEEQRLYMENTIYKHCFYLAAQGYKGASDGLGGITLQHNHNFFCNGGVSMAALAFMDVYPEISSSLVSDAVRLVELVIKTLAPNGASEEGPGYTSIISDNMSKMYASIDTALGNLYNIDISEGLSDIVPFFFYIQSDVTGFNYSECDDGTQPFSSAGLLWLCSHYKIKGFKDVIAKAKAFRYNYNEELVPLLLWYEPGSESEEAKLSLDKFYPRYSLISMRNTFGSNQVFVGLKGGETVSSIFNSHMDQGSFVFDALGQRWANDLGKDDYNLPGYNDRLNTRWNIFRLRSEGHNTITINPDKNPGFVVKSKADITDFDSGTTKSKAVVDMSEVLADHVTGAKRGFLFTDNRTSLVVRDEINLKEQSDIYWIMYTKTTATQDGNKVTLTKSNKSVTIDFISSHPGEIIIESAAPMSTAPVVSGQSSNSGYTRIIYKVNASGTANITAKFTPKGAAADSDVTDVSAYDNAISTWKVN
ncbi:MAG: heparinase II/III family protein [Clostridia bacterium]|nr:heparinase II/III family protein [Clostridia bacterium]